MQESLNRIKRELYFFNRIIFRKKWSVEIEEYLKNELKKIIYSFNRCKRITHHEEFSTKDLPTLYEFMLFDSEISIRLYNCLKHAIEGQPQFPATFKCGDKDIKLSYTMKLDIFEKIEEQELSKIKNFGKKSLRELKSECTKYNVVIGLHSIVSDKENCDEN